MSAKRTQHRRGQAARRLRITELITDLTLAETQLLRAKNASTYTYGTALSAAATLALSAGVLGAFPD